MNTNNVLKISETYPQLCKPLLTYSEILDKVTAEKFIEFVKWEDNSEQQERSMFSEAIQSLTEDELSDLILFMSGSRDFSIFGESRISVKFRNVSGVFASTCSLGVVLPKSSTRSLQVLQGVLKAAISGDDFNTV